MRDIVSQWGDRTQGARPLGRFGNRGVVTRKIRFVWVVKGKGQVGYFASELERVITDVKNLQNNHQEGVEVDISVYVTCDESFTNERNSVPPESSTTFSQERGKVEEVGSAGSNDEKNAPQVDESKIKIEEKTKEEV
jgi:hemerythrin-like domain-containing protein